jgi:hypothetical protein
MSGGWMPMAIAEICKMKIPIMEDAGQQMKDRVEIRKQLPIFDGRRR